MHKSIITISREYGSGGRHIGKCVADKLGIPFYDKKLITQVAKESGLDIKFVEETGEYSATDSFLYNLAISNIYPFDNIYSKDSMTLENKIYIFQAKVIKEAAEKGPCVIVGRCADYILRDRKDCLNVFIHADIEKKRERVIEYQEVNVKDVDREIRRVDKARANHYNQYTGEKWGNIKNYHLSIDSGAFGIDGSVEMICKACEL